MKKLTAIALTTALALVVFSVYALTTVHNRNKNRWQAYLLEPTTPAGNPTNGEYIANVAGCIGCHTNYANGGALLAGGVAIETPFGKFISPNITMDKQAGIGNWSGQQFAKAIVLGTNETGNHYYPAFPYNAYTHLSSQDIIDLHEWIKTVATASDNNIAHQLNPAVSFRALVVYWKALYFKQTSKASLNDRGAYLVNGPGHCAECHSQRNILGGIVNSTMSGNSRGPDGESVPGITSRNLEQWTIEDIDLFLEVGITPSGDSTGGHMADVIEYNTSFLTNEDRQAIANFLKSESNTP